MSLSFKDSLEKNNEIIKPIVATESATAAAFSVDDMNVEPYGVMTLDENYGIAAYAGDDGNWTQHTGYVYYSTFSDDNLSTINDKKEITLNDKQINITQEENSQFIPFEMPRYYDGYDLTKPTISVHYETKNGRHGASKVVNVTYNNEKIRFGWLVDADATIDAGKLKFEIQAHGVVPNSNDGKGNPLGYVWKTRTNENLNVLQSLCDCGDVINKIDDSWMQELITDIANKIAEDIKDIAVGEQVEAAEQAARDAQESANVASQYAENASNAATEALNEVLGDYATTDYVDTAIAGVDVTEQLKDYAKTEDVDATVLGINNNLQNNYYTKTEIDSTLESYATKDDVADAITEADISEKLNDYYKKSETYSKTEVDEALANISLDGYATETYVDNKVSPLSSSIGTNTENISSLSTTVGKLQSDVNAIDKSPRKTYEATYGDVTLDDGTVQESMFTLWETEGSDEPTVKSRFKIVGGGGGGAAAGNNLTISYDKNKDGKNITQYVFTKKNTEDNEAIIYYGFSGVDSAGDDVSYANATWKTRKGTSGTWTTLLSTTIYPGDKTPFDVSKYVSTGTCQVQLIATDESGGYASKTWTIQVVDVRLESSFNDTYTRPVGQSVTFDYTPYGAVSKDIHFKLNGADLNKINTSASGIANPVPFEIPAQAHGSYLLEAYITAEVNGQPIRTESIYRDIMFYDSESNVPVIGCSQQNITMRQYDTVNIIYHVFDPSTNYPIVKKYVGNNLVDTETLTKSQNTWTFQTDEIGVHALKIVVGDTEKTIIVNVTELGIDVSPITAGLEIDFNPTGMTNSPVDRIWSNSKYAMNVSDNFDWANGGYRQDDNGDTYFLIKAGTRVSFDYLMFSGGLERNPSVTGSEMKLIFMTENVQDSDAVWFSNVEKTTTEVEGVTQTTNVGIQLGVHEGWLKTNNASDTDIEGDDDSGSIAATNTYLYMPYSEEDIIEMDINIDTLAESKAFAMAYEDGVPSKAYVYDSSDRFYQYTPQPITIGSDYCDVRIYRMKIYSNSLTTENIMKNFIADARNSTTMLDRYDRNSIYFNRETNTYTPYRGEGVIDPEKLAPVVPNVKILMLETDHFTTSKKTFVKSNFRCIHASGGDMFEGDSYYDNWLFENGWHSGQGTTSDNYGNSSRNIDFLFNCDGVHKPSDKVNAESDYISQVTLGYGTENETTEVVTDWKGDSGKVSLTRTSVPNNFFNLKVNVASSENVNNMLLQKRYNDFLPYISPAKKRNPNIKNSMEFVPAILFIRETNPDISTHTEFLDTEWHFYSLGNIGDSKKTDYTRAYDPEDMNEFTLEISDNTKNNAVFQSGVYLDDNGNRQIEKFTITESEDDGEIILTPVSIDKPQSFVYPITTEEWENEDNMRHWCIYNEGFDGDHSFEARYACCGDYRDGKLVNDTSGRGEAQMKLNEGVWRAFYRWVVTSTNEEFVNELDEWCVRSAVEFFYAFTHYHTMMDNRAKNTFWHFAKTGTYRKVSKPVPELLHIYCELVGDEYITTTDMTIDSSKTYYTQYAFDMHDYDNDTALGINNNGELVFPYGKEDTDYNVEDNPQSGYVFNGATSVFWCRLRDLLPNEIKTTFQTVASECFSATNLINQFDAYQECYPEEIWRLDIERKYIRTFTGKSIDNSKPKLDVQYLRDMMQGRKKYQRRQWTRDQEIYFGTMNLMNTVVGDDNRITFRCFTPTGNDVKVAPDYTLRITPYSDMYISVAFGNSSPKPQRAKAGVEYTITCPLSTMDDTQVTIYGANRIQALNDLSACYIAANNFSMATKLRKLVVGSTVEGYNNSKLISLTLGDNKLLEELDIRNCNNLTGALNLTQCNNLLKLYAEGTKITGVTFATNGKIQVAHLPSTINTLIMRNLNDLIDFQAALNQVETLTLQGGNLDSLDVVARCINTLQVLYLYDINWALSNTELLDKISRLFYSLLTGKVHVPTIEQKKYNDYNDAWSDLEITYNTMIVQHPVTFVNEDGTVLEVQYVNHGDYAVDPITRADNPISTPTKESTVSTDYTFVGWDNLLTSQIFAALTVTATYSESIREYTIRYVSNGVVKQESVGKYGENIPYDFEVNGIPTYTYEENAYNYYLFNRWDKSGFIDGDKTVTAIFDSFKYTGANSFAGKDIGDLKPVELYALTKLTESGNTPSYFGMSIEVGDPFSFTMGYDVDFDDIESVEVISEKTTFTGSNHLDTGIKLFDEDRDFVLALDYTISGDNTTAGTFMQCFQTSGANGFKLGYSGSAPDFAWGSATPIKPSSVDNREMLVIRHKKGDNNLYVYVSNLDSIEPTSYTIERNAITKTDSDTATLVFGAAKMGSGRLDKYCMGDVYWCKIWYQDLGEKACEQLVGWTHEEITLGVSGFYRYPLYDDRNKETTVSLLASHLLERQMRYNSTNTNAGGWANSDLNKILNSRFYNAMPVQIRLLLKKMCVLSTIGQKSSEVSESGCYINIPSVYDVYVRNVDGAANERYNIELYDGASTIETMTSQQSRRREFRYGFENDNIDAYESYWLRSPDFTGTYSTNYYVWCVNENFQMDTQKGTLSSVNQPSSYRGVLIEISF